jgi:hypothetical protein
MDSAKGVPGLDEPNARRHTKFHQHHATKEKPYLTY